MRSGRSLDGTGLILRRRPRRHRRRTCADRPAQPAGADECLRRRPAPRLRVAVGSQVERDAEVRAAVITGNCRHSAPGATSMTSAVPPRLRGAPAQLRNARRLVDEMLSVHIPGVGRASTGSSRRPRLRRSRGRSACAPPSTSCHSGIRCPWPARSPRSPSWRRAGSRSASASVATIATRSRPAASTRPPGAGAPTSRSASSGGCSPARPSPARLASSPSTTCASCRCRIRRSR